MRGCSGSKSILVAVLSAMLLAGCANTRVVRGPIARNTSGPVRVSTPRYGATAIVHRGETLYRIATDNGLSALDLAMWNEIAPPYTIHPGQRLRLYPLARGERPSLSAHSVTARPPTPPSAPTATTHAVAPAVAAAPGTTTPTASAAAAPPDSSLAWRWPADGSLANRYVAGEPTQQGIDIAGQAGQPVRAAADGVVVYSGAGLVGYGELIIVKHNDAWLSAYGHNRARLVNEGQVVKAGQQIAEMGHSGAARDMLHFEIRYNGKPVDPLEYLPKR